MTPVCSHLFISQVQSGVIFLGWGIKWLHMKYDLGKVHPSPSPVNSGRINHFLGGGGTQSMLTAQSGELLRQPR